MPTPKPDYDADFEQAIEKWRGQYKIKEKGGGNRRPIFPRRDQRAF
jgi:hypothetical protein